MGQNMVVIRSSNYRAKDGEGMGVIGHCSAASLNNGLGRYAWALTAAQRACECPPEIARPRSIPAGWHMPANRLGARPPLGPLSRPGPSAPDRCAAPRLPIAPRGQ